MKEFYANTIEEGTWRYLDLFSRYDFLKTISPTIEKAKRINFCIKIAKEYYRCAKSSSTLIKPVILYYGMLNLAKSLILFKDSSIIINKHLKSHGIGRKRSILPKKLFSLSCNIGTDLNSVLPKLMNVAKNDRFNILTTINGKAAYKDLEIIYPDQLNNIGNNYKVSELVVLIPELFDLNIEAAKLLPWTIPLHEFIIRCRTDQKNNKELFSGDIAFKHFRNHKIKNSIKSFEKKDELKDWQFFEDIWDIISYRIPQETEVIFRYPDIRETIFRENYSLFYKSEKYKFSEIIIHYILTFIFGDIARYDPFIWARLMEKNIQENRIIEAFFDLTIVKFPLLILRELRDELIYFKQV